LPDGYILSLNCKKVYVKMFETVMS
jgi:hypothetical protein